MLQMFTFTGVRQIQSRADFIKYESGSGANQAIELRADGQALGTYLPGDSIKLPLTVSLIEVNPAAGCSGTLRVGLGNIISNRLIVSGTLDMAQNTARTLGGRHFQGWAETAAGSSNGVGLRANGATVAVHKIVTYGTTGTARPVVTGTAPGTGVATASPITPRNRLIGGAAPVAYVGFGALTNWAALPTAGELPGAAWLAPHFVTVSSDKEINFERAPLILTGTQVLMVQAQGLLNAFFEWEEL